MIDGEQQFFKRIVGLDLGGGRGKSTAVAVIELGSETPRLVSASVRTRSGRPWRDDELTAFLSREAETTLVCLDAPTSLPPCLRCRIEHCPGIRDCPDPAVARMREMAPGTGKGGKPRFTPYTQRPEDLALILAGLPATGALDASRGPLAARVHHLLRRLSGRYEPGENLIELPLAATLRVWFGEKTARGCRASASVWTSRAQVLEAFAHRLSFAIWREPILSHTHLFSAVTCGVAGLTWWEATRRGSKEPGRHGTHRGTGALWVPNEAWPA